MFKQFTFLLLGIFAVAVAATAQECMYRYTHYTVEDGLPNLMVYDVMQDQEGFIWLATESGLVRYDGYTFKTFTTEDGLPGNDVLRMFPDPQGRIWMAIYGKGICYKDGNRVVRINNPDLMTDGSVLTIDHHADSTTWIGTAIEGLFIYKDTTQLGRYLRFPTAVDTAFRQFTSATDGDNNTWVQSSLIYGCCGIDPQEQYNIDRSFNSETYDPYVVQWLGRRFGVCITTRRVILRHTDAGLQQVFPVSSSGNYNIMGIDTLASGDIVVSTDAGAFMVKLSANDEPAILPLFTGEAVSSVLEDQEGNLWISTLRNGLFFINKSAREVEELLQEDITCLATYDDKVLAGADRGKLFVINDTVRRFTLPMLKNTYFPRVNEILVSEEHGATYMGTDKYVMSYYGNWSSFEERDYDIDYRIYVPKYPGRTIVKDSIPAYFIGIGSVKGLACSNDTVFVAASAGLFFRKHQDGRDSPYSLIEAGRYVGIQTDHWNNIWVANLQGLWRYHDSLNLVLTEDSLRNYITDMHTAEDGALWMGTNGSGIFIKSKRQLRQLKFSGLAGANIINSIQVYHASRVALIGTNKGIFMVRYNDDHSQLSATPWQHNSGLPSLMVRTLLLDKDKLYVATSKGLVQAPFAFEQTDHTPLDVVINEVWIKDSIYPIRDSYRLNYQQNDISISFVGLSFSSQRRITYQYRIEEQDTSWRETDANQVDLSSLSPGIYTFAIRAKSINGTWQDNIRKISFSIVPPYWQTTWFLLLMLGGVILIVIIIAVVYVRYNRNKDELARKLMELEGQALRAQMNPHFVFNSLNAVHDFIADKDQRSAHLYLSRFAKLIRRILDHSRRTLVSLDEEIETLNLYIQLEQMRFEGKFKYELDLLGELETDIIHLPPMIIQPYVENAIRHGLMNRTGPGGLLSIRVYIEEAYLYCIVEDNGIGRQASAVINQKHGIAHKSYAMEITRERLDKLQHAGKDQGQVEIVDLTDEQGRAVGTRIIIQFNLIEEV